MYLESDMERNKIAQGKSSQVVSIGYQKENKLLEIEFSSGGVYQYSGVPESLYDAFIHSDSLGVFVATQIRGAFKYRRLHGFACLPETCQGAEICPCWCHKVKTSKEEKPSVRKNKKTKTVQS